jgi:starch synthase
MHILFATPEIAPFTQTGDLADHCAVLADALRSYKPGKFLQASETSKVESLLIPNPIDEISVITPLSTSMDKAGMRLAKRLKTLDLDGKKVAVYEGRTPQRVRVFFLEHPSLDSEKESDDAVRFAFFSRAVVEFCKAFTLPIDIIHCQDWPTALIPIYLDAFGDEHLEEVLTVFSVHDMRKQGTFDQKSFKKFGLPKAYLAEDALAQGDEVNFTKGGVLFADFITTPSQALIEESGKTSIGEMLSDREDDVFGVPNGLDCEMWDPSKDEFLAAKYDVTQLNGKRRNKADVQHIFGLPPRPMDPLMGFLSPLEKTKGVEILIRSIETILAEDTHTQFIFMTDGSEVKYKRKLVALAERFPKNIGLHFGKDLALEHRVLAGIDTILLPSKVEHDNHIPLRAMRYGTVPIARNTGALKDTISDWDGLGEGPARKGAGVLFEDHSDRDLTEAIDQAIEMLKTPSQWRPVVKHCMRADFSWAQTAHQYVELYKDLLGED